MFVLHLFYYLHNLLYISRFKRFTIDLRQEARDEYRVRKAAPRIDCTHAFPGLIAGREIKVKARCSVFVSMRRKIGRGYNVCATEIFRLRVYISDRVTKLFAELFVSPNSYSLKYSSRRR